MAIELAREPLPEYFLYSDESVVQKAIALLKWTECMPDWFYEKDVVWAAETDHINAWFPNFEEQFADFDNCSIILKDEQLFISHVLDGIMTLIPFKFDPLTKLE